MGFVLLRVQGEDEWDEHLLVRKVPHCEEYLTRTTTADGATFVWSAQRLGQEGHDCHYEGFQ
eukprot:2119394-Lingulodinium_polyedra.AAC.1